MKHDKVEEEVCHGHAGSGALSGLVNVRVVLVGEGCICEEFMKEVLEWIG